MDSVPGLESSTLETADGKLREPHSEARPSRTNTTTTTTTSLSTVSPVRLEKSESETFVAPDGGYGWVVVGTSILLVAQGSRPFLAVETLKAASPFRVW